MTPLHLTHYSAALIFAFFASIVFGITQKNTPREMVRYGIQSFIFFAVGTILAGWLMAGIHALARR
jgi:Na+/H+-dicarboxylate symporter